MRLGLRTWLVGTRSVIAHARLMRAVCSLALIGAVLLAFGGCVARPSETAAPVELLDAGPPLVTGSRQVLLVVGDNASPSDSRFVRVWLLERDVDSTRGALGSTAWRTTFGPIPGVIGAGGFASPGEKREGDKRTPSGVFTITEAFGVFPIDETFRPRLAYTRITTRHQWCEDPSSPNYNSWVVLPEAKSPLWSPQEAEIMRLGVVIDYNRPPTSPVVPGIGSGIFIHAADADSPSSAGTLGCLGLTPTDLRRVVLALDPARRPAVVMGREEELARLVR